MRAGRRRDWENALVDPNTRQGKRTPVTLKIKFKSETLEQFIERYAVDVSQGGIFIRTKEPLAVGTQMRFEFQLRDASPLIAGEGTVVWTRENDPSRPAIAPGMGVRFDRLAEGSQGVLERILSEKAKQAPSRPHTEQTKPPMFTDTPTRVAPLPVQDALLGANADSSRKHTDSFGDQGTPLPRPMPFHSDAEDFDEQAFEEATKVRSLDELIAETRDSPAKAQEAAARRGGRGDATVSDPPRAETATAVEVPPAAAAPVDRDSAPVLPSPPEASRPQPRLLDTTPSPRDEEAAPAVAAAAAASDRKASATTPPGLSDGAGAKTQLGVEPAKTPARASTPSTSPVAKAVAKESPAAKKEVVAKDAPTKPTGLRPVQPEKPSSSAPLFILLLLLVAAGGAVVWFFVLREKAEDSVATRPVDTGSGSATTGSGSDSMLVTNGSNDLAGSGSGSSAEVGSGSAGSAAVVVPAADLVETTIGASGEKATVEVIGTDQSGPAPLKAKLEKGKAYKARIQAPGFLMTEIDVKGGEKAAAKLVAKPRVISVTSEPPGAAITIDNASTGKTTPFTVELTKAQAAKKSVRVGLRKTGFKAVERVVDAGKYTEDAAQMIAKLEESMVVQAPPVTNTNTGGGTTTTVKPPTGSGSGSATTTTTPPTGTGSGSATTPTGTGTGSGSATPPTGTGTGTGSATPPTGTGAGSGSATTTPVTPKPSTGTGTGAGSGSASPSAVKSEPEPDFMKKP
ncbi:MAG: type pilus assembly PilZ [Myxococcales bacterium]|nr:type pilus assembly PilZ [Myxococcales bacterium]